MAEQDLPAKPEYQHLYLNGLNVKGKKLYL